MATKPSERFRRNASSITTTVVTGIWLAALFTGQGWWLAALLFGYVVVVPVVSMLFGDEEDWEEHAEDEQNRNNEQWEDGWFGGEWTSKETDSESPETENGDALEVLRNRYARGDLTDEQFERKLEQLLETDTIENAEVRNRERERLRE